MSGAAGRRLFNHSGTALLFRGALALLLALTVAALPVSTVFALAYVFGIYAMADGLANVAHFFYDPARHSRWSMVGGMASIVAGLIAVSWPGITDGALTVLTGIWALTVGVSQLLLALDGRAGIEPWRIPALTGAVLAVLGIFLIANPGAGILALAGLLAAFAALFGLLLIFSGVEWRRRGARPRTV
ncbi:hypothetical protein BIU82_14665 [Arthrobacter sp. SW1]|uniref:HdeD family acid-resistance protein n=1 Tax=Arthrobacter sp. SW1 TaxID=1920889 RepID=UPI000877C50D|nr:DUF308 domain-containing protein [Arthrobacter sp. SW1]OFI39332.1 hypothetical protein BIU82_14665 [Arthrobacter sp. SW1]